MAAADSRDSFGTVDYTHEDTAGAFADFETAKFSQPPKTMQKEWKCIRLRPLRLRKWQSNRRLAQPMRAKNQGPLDGTKKSGNLLASLQFIFPTSSASAMRRSGAGNVAGGRQAAGELRD